MGNRKSENLSLRSIPKWRIALYALVLLVGLAIGMSFMRDASSPWRLTLLFITIITVFCGFFLFLDALGKSGVLRAKYQRSFRIIMTLWCLVVMVRTIALLWEWLKG